MHLKIVSSRMITPIGPKMSAAIEELIRTSYLKNKNEILPGMVHIPGRPCHVTHVSHTNTGCWDTGLKPM